MEEFIYLKFNQHPDGDIWIRADQISTVETTPVDKVSSVVMLGNRVIKVTGTPEDVLECLYAAGVSVPTHSPERMKEYATALKISLRSYEEDRKLRSPHGLPPGKETTEA